MSYHLQMQKADGKPVIEMPPLIEEPVVEQAVSTEEMVENPAQNLQEMVENPSEEPKHAVEAKFETKKDNDLRALREKAKRAEQAERERDELLRWKQEMEMRKPEVKEEPDYELAPDELVDAKYMKRYEKSIKELRDELKTYKQQTTISNTDARLKAKYPDLDKVVSRENLEALRQDYPELADTINSSNDLYSKAVTAYTLIKKLNINPEDEFVEDKQKAQVNIAKPRPLASVAPQQGESPLTRANAFANGLTPALQAQLRKEMDDARKNM